MSNQPGVTPRSTFLITAILAVLILISSLWSFGNKFIEFVALFRGEVDGAFAISPICNYLFASMGFFCLLCWATLNGMFRDIEQPKRALLETEQWLDRQEAERSKAHGQAAGQAAGEAAG